MKTMGSLTGWVVQKISSYLETKEGFSQVSSKTTIEGYKAVIEDAFGFRYEIEVRMVGRIHDLPDFGIERTIFDHRDSRKA